MHSALVPTQLRLSQALTTEGAGEERGEGNAVQRQKPEPRVEGEPWSKQEEESRAQKQMQPARLGIGAFCILVEGSFWLAVNERKNLFWS
jgi:hypothetical protein